MKKRLLYLMHVPWGWVKQRPHFLAEHLAPYYDVTILCKKSYRKRNLVDNTEPESILLDQMFVLPFDKLPLISLANSHLMKFQIRKLLRSADLVWLTHPALHAAIAGVTSNTAPIVYDCMDDALNFPAVKASRRSYEMVAASESALCRQSTVILASSQNLKTKIIERYSIDKSKIYVVNNGININQSAPARHPLNNKFLQAFRSTKTKLVYIGTISDWFDFELILQSLEKVKNIEYLLIGPAEVPIPPHENITHLGPVDHSYIPILMAMSDVLIMPFKLNELVLSVNPVKLYEYISSNKPSISVRYAETLPFEEYIYLYSTPEGYNEIIEQVISGCRLPKKGTRECDEFLNESSWESRVNKIQGIISDAC